MPDYYFQNLPNLLKNIVGPLKLTFAITLSEHLRLETNFDAKNALAPFHPALMNSKLLV